MKFSDRAFSSLHNRAAKLALAAAPAAWVLMSISASPAQAQIVFQFNSQALLNDAGANGTTDPSNPSNVYNSPNNVGDIQTYMDGLLTNFHSGWSVTVLGAMVTGGYGAYNHTTHNYAQGNNTGYTADGNVLCANTSSGCTSNTLAAILGMPVVATNGQLQVDSTGKSVTVPAGADPNSVGDDAISMAFGGGVKVTSLTFSFEIFPDASCANGHGTCSVPDFNFLMKDGNGNVIENVPVNAVFPGTSGLDCPTEATRSPAQGTNATADQCIGTMSFSFAAVTNPTLEFIDWPDTIGITNIDWGVPEPGSLALLGSGLLGFGLIRRRRRRT